jgi:predicted secreted hydrolase
MREFLISLLQHSSLQYTAGLLVIQGWRSRTLHRSLIATSAAEKLPTRASAMDACTGAAVKIRQPVPVKTGMQAEPWRLAGMAELAWQQKLAHRLTHVHAASSMQH